MASRGRPVNAHSPKKAKDAGRLWHGSRVRLRELALTQSIA